MTILANIRTLGQNRDNHFFFSLSLSFATNTTTALEGRLAYMGKCGRKETVGDTLKAVDVRLSVLTTKACMEKKNVTNLGKSWVILGSSQAGIWCDDVLCPRMGFEWGVSPSLACLPGHICESAPSDLPIPPPPPPPPSPHTSQGCQVESIVAILAIKWLCLGPEPRYKTSCLRL